jgi:alpha-L-fucosidase 2
MCKKSRKIKIKQMKKSIISLVFLTFIFTYCSCSKRVKVACIGDSITNGGGKGKSSFYPVQLDSLLGKEFEVLNFGESGATMQKDGNKPYWHQKDFHNVFAYKPEVIVIMLGTNDSKTYVWNETSYERDYQLMIDALNTINPKPQIYLCFPPPAFSSNFKISDSTIRLGVIPAIRKIANKNNLQIIDMYEQMTEMSSLFPDGIHPDKKGRLIMAKIIAESIDE